MKLAFNTFACPTWLLKDLLTCGASLGYHGVEVRCDAGQAHGVEIYASKKDRRELSRAFETSGLAICCLGTSVQLSSLAAVEDAMPRLELAVDLGCPGIRIFCGPVPEGDDHDFLLKQASARLRDMAFQSENLGEVDIWVHMHDTVSTGASARKLVAAADHPRVGLIYDNLHPYRHGESPRATLSYAGKYVRMAHFHDGMNLLDKVEITPIGRGQMPIDEQFKALLEIEYNGYICGEWFYQQYGEDPELNLQRYKDEIEDLCRRFKVRLA